MATKAAEDSPSGILEKCLCFRVDPLEVMWKMLQGGGFFLEDAAKRVFLEGAAKLCFSLICGKLLGKFHFQSFLFAASSRGNCNFGGLLLQQAPRKLSGKSHLQVLLLQAIGEIEFWGFSFPASSWELCICNVF